MLSENLGHFSAAVRTHHPGSHHVAVTLVAPLILRPRLLASAPVISPAIANSVTATTKTFIDFMASSFTLHFCISSQSAGQDIDLNQAGGKGACRSHLTSMTRALPDWGRIQG